MMLCAPLTIAVGIQNLIPPAARDAPFDRPIRQKLARSSIRALDTDSSRSSNPHRSRSPHRRPSVTRFPPWKGFERRPQPRFTTPLSERRRPKPLTKGEIVLRTLERPHRPSGAETRGGGGLVRYPLKLGHTCSHEVVFAFTLGEVIEEFANAVPKSLDGSFGGLSKEGL